MKAAVFVAFAAIIATQIACTWWLAEKINSRLDPIAYNAAYFKLAADDWESGKSAVTCKDH